MLHSPLLMLWKLAEDCAAVSRDEFERYFCGLDQGVGIELRAVTRLCEPFPLAELRRVWPGFHPPQGFRYVTGEEVARLTLKRLAV